jgi:phage baseplate assembly protein W
MNRSDKFTIEQKKVEYYSDILTNFDKNPLTGYLARVTNEESIKQSLKSLILTQRTERPFQPWLGSRVYSLLFELNNPMTDFALIEEIKSTIEICESRVSVEDVKIYSNQDRDTNEINITIIFKILSAPELIHSLDFVLTRVR